MYRWVGQNLRSHSMSFMHVKLEEQVILFLQYVPENDSEIIKFRHWDI